MESSERTHTGGRENSIEKKKYVEQRREKEVLIIIVRGTHGELDGGWI
jgi:hypothetical protein